MIEQLTDLPDGVLGFQAHGELHADDYTSVLYPAVDAALDAGQDLRVLLIFEEWGGMSTGAFRKDFRMGMEHLKHWKKIALVTDIEWMAHVTHLFGWMTPGEMKQFPVAERDAAIAWLTTDDADG